MSLEILDSLVIPEKIESDSRNSSKVSAERSVSPRNVHNTEAVRHRASTGSLNTRDRATRSSIKKSVSACSSQHVVPHYLRASTGSCHDLCKFGRSHSSKEKPGTPPWKRCAKPLPSELNPVPVKVVDDQKNEKVVNLKHLTKPKTLSRNLKSLPDSKPHSSKPKTPLDEGKVVKYKLTTNSKNDHLDSKTSFPKQNKTLSPTKKPSCTKKVSSPGSPEIIKNVVFPSGKVEGRVLQGFSTTSKGPRPQKTAPSSPIQHSSEKSKPVKVTPVLCTGTSYVDKERQSNEVASRNVIASKAPAKTNLAPPAASMSTKSSLIGSASSKSRSTGPSFIRSAFNKSRETGKLKSVFSPVIQNRMGQDRSNTSNVKKVSERTLHVVKTESENNICTVMPDGHGTSSTLLSHEGGNKVVEYSDCEQDKHIDQNDEPLEIGHVQSVCEDRAVSPLPSSPESSLADSSSLLSQEEGNKEIEYIDGEPEKLFSNNEDSLEFENMLIVADGHAISSFPSSPRSLSYAESSSLLSIEEFNAELEYGDGVPDKYISGNIESLEIGNVQSVPDDHAVSSVPSSPKSKSFAESSSLLSDEEDTKEIEYNGGDPHNYDDESLEIGTVVHLVPNEELEYHNVERDKCFSDTDNHAASTAKPSLALSEEDGKEMKYVQGEPHFSENDAIMETGNVQSACDSHDVSSFPSPLSSLSNSVSASLLSEKECIKEISYSDGESYVYISENDESLEIGNVPPAEGNHHKAHTKSGVVIYEDKDSTPVKLKFKTGKVIELQPDDNCPRKLKFRRSRAARVENEKADSRRELKKSEAGGNIAGMETSSEKIVLKHQDLQEKRDAQGLLNNVIEETVSKLVDVRKSKVKALVGAFETVISLGESKHSS